MRKKKLVFIGNIPAPYMVKWINALNKYFDAEGWFYEAASEKRDSFWDISLEPYCRLLPEVQFAESGRYLTRAHLAEMETRPPDILLLGGFSIPANYLAYRWAKKKGIPTCVLTETSREEDGRLRGPTLLSRAVRFAYRDLDAVLALTEEAYDQFRQTLGFGAKVLQARYPCDLDAYLEHPLRSATNAPRLLYANRLISLYNPLEAIRIFAAVHRTLPEATLRLNSSGPLQSDSIALIHELGLQDSVSFLDNLQHWDDLDEVYKKSDILLLPANNSAGNFTIYEALASGMGLVISDQIAGSGRIIENGINGFRIPINTENMAEAVLRYCLEPELLETHARLNRPKMESLGIDGTSEFYHQLLSKHFPTCASS